MLLPPGFADFHCTLLEVASARHSSAPTEADWIRWAGVAIAVAGALIATPDGTLVVWQRITSARNWIRDRLAGFLPFLRRTISVEAKLFGDSGAGAEHMSVDRRIAW